MGKVMEISGLGQSTFLPDGAHHPGQERVWSLGLGLNPLPDGARHSGPAGPAASWLCLQALQH